MPRHQQRDGRLWGGAHASGEDVGACAVCGWESAHIVRGSSVSRRLSDTSSTLSEVSLPMEAGSAARSFDWCALEAVTNKHAEVMCRAETIW